MVNFTEAVKKLNSYKGSEKKKTLIYDEISKIYLIANIVNFARKCYRIEV